MEQKEDEEISIDFGKIKNFFKKEKKEEKTAEVKEPAGEKKETEDDISIDFSKIKNIFKNKEPEKTESRQEGKKSEEIELSFDFSKIKKIFKPEERAASDEVAVDFGKIAGLFKKYGVILVVLIPVVLSVYIRLQGDLLPITDEWAANSVFNSIRAQIRAGIDQQYPNLPDANKNALVDTEVQKIASQNRQQIGEQIRQTSAYFKSFFQDEKGYRYMPDIDPYYWFRYAKNILERGHPGDILKDNKPFDTYQLAPLGRFVVPDMFHSYALAYFHKLASIFVPNMDLMRSSFYLTPFVSALCVLLVFFIARKIAGNIGGFFAAMMMAVNSAFLSRSLHPDNDVWVVFFPLLVTWLFLITEESRSMAKITIIAALAGLFTGMFTFAWSGWWYIFDFLLATIFVTFLYLVFSSLGAIKKSVRAAYSNEAIRSLVAIGIVYFISTALFTTLFSGWATFRNSFFGPLSFPSIKAPVQAASLWPNVLTTVAELNEGSVNQIINSVGGNFLFFISLLGLIFSVSRAEGLKKFDFIYIIATAAFYGSFFILQRWGVGFSLAGTLIWIMIPIAASMALSIYKKDPSYDFKLSILLSLWIISTIFASIKGIRFTLLLAPAFSVAFGVALGKGFLYSVKLLTKELKIHKFIANSILLVLLLFVFYTNPVRGAISAARSDLPIINDAWHNSLAAIKKDSTNNAIITSWWDFGHHFKAIAERKVTFDGTTQTAPAAHWVGRLLMASDENEAIGILRMLDCGSNNAINILNGITKDQHLSLRIVRSIILLDKSGADRALDEFKFSKEQKEEILSFTHCSPPEAYFIASEDMIGKSGVWGHFGSWSFERADLWQNARKMPQEEAVEYMIRKFNYSRAGAENIYFEMQSITSDKAANDWIAPWPGYAENGRVINCNKNGEAYSCENGLQVNMSNFDVFALGQQGIVRPKSASFPAETGTIKKEFRGATLDFGVAIVRAGEDSLGMVLSTNELTRRMFTRMFYMQGHGLKYFKLFNHQRGLTGTDIFVYKIDWEGENTTIVKEYADFLKKPAESEVKTTISNSTDGS